MKIETVKEFYVSELVGMSFIERYSYELLNNWTVDTDKFKISLNPLRWCLLDLIKLCWFPVLCLLLIVVALTVIPYLAHKTKEKYKDKKYEGWYQHNIKILRL